MLTKRTCNLPLICQICGDIARGINFEVMTCMSCKAFFRRHALQSKNFQCQLNSNCEITRLTRGGCTACRLKKCLSLGMDSTLIRSKQQKSARLSKTNNQLLSKPLPLNLLQNDSSTLTTMEWNLLSNILHAYDSNNAINHTKSLLDHQASLAPKIRSKLTTILDIIGYFYSTTQSFFQRTPFFCNLSVDIRRAVIQRNSEITGAYNSLFLAREANAFDYSAYVVSCCNLYGEENFDKFKKSIPQLEPNGIFFKIMLLIVAFSSNSSIVISENPTTMVNIISIIQIQNTLVTMFWKYLNYQYGFLGAVKCFSYFIRSILSILRWTNESSSVQHTDMLDTIIEKTERLLTNEHEMIE